MMNALTHNNTTRDCLISALALDDYCGAGSLFTTTSPPPHTKRTKRTPWPYLSIIQPAARKGEKASHLVAKVTPRPSAVDGVKGERALNRYHRPVSVCIQRDQVRRRPPLSGG